VVPSSSRQRGSTVLQFSLPQIEDTFAQTATDESGEHLPLSASKKFRMNAKKDLLAWTGNAVTKYDFYNNLCCK
jgi:hypothetical protein